MTLLSRPARRDALAGKIPTKPGRRKSGASSGIPKADGAHQEGYAGLTLAPYVYKSIDDLIEHSRRRDQYRGKVRTDELEGEELRLAARLNYAIRRESDMDLSWGMGMIMDDRPGGLTWVALPPGLVRTDDLTLSAGGIEWVSLARNLFTFEPCGTSPIDLTGRVEFTRSEVRLDVTPRGIFVAGWPERSVDWSR